MARRRKWYDNSKQSRLHERQERIIDEFCEEHGVKRSASGNSFYFRLHGRNYRVSDHSRRQSDYGMFDVYGNEIRKSYRKPHRKEYEIVCGKTKFIDVYLALASGKTVNGRGVIIDKEDPAQEGEY